MNNIFEKGYGELYTLTRSGGRCYKVISLFEIKGIGNKEYVTLSDGEYYKR